MCKSAFYDHVGENGSEIQRWMIMVLWKEFQPPIWVLHMGQFDDVSNAWCNCWWWANWIAWYNGSHLLTVGWLDFWRQVGLEPNQNLGPIIKMKGDTWQTMGHLQRRIFILLGLMLRWKSRALAMGSDGAGVPRSRWCPAIGERRRRRFALQSRSSTLSLSLPFFSSYLFLLSSSLCYFFLFCFSFLLCFFVCRREWKNPKKFRRWWC